MADSKNHSITLGGEDRIHQASNLYQTAFQDDPVITYMLCNLSTPARHNYLYSYFTSLMTASALNGGIIEQADDWSSCSVLIPPGKRVDNPWTLVPAGILGALFKLGIAGCRRMLFEYEPLTDAARRKALGGQKEFYYVFFVATRAEARGRGLSSALLKSAQRRAAEEQVPVWLEATTEYSWKLYQKLGFETIDTIVLGRGYAGPDGSQQKGGEGVPVRGMIWWPSKAT
ncbi:hypothetical protein B0A55_03797 [Friedmanniomyces simplex]|uniref:N-acetyltransferase domain-containing protein n=1 Tax=Friedmanniomyces simplex TaxID=329884 RepID=A0A4U0XCK8_9PEZI|nr:hypothetical protein B0A55_03797 [Friedmanniomyces simplex]